MASVETYDNPGFMSSVLGEKEEIRKEDIIIDRTNSDCSPEKSGNTPQTSHVHPEDTDTCLPAAFFM